MSVFALSAANLLQASNSPSTEFSGLRARQTQQAESVDPTARSGADTYTPSQPTGNYGSALPSSAPRRSSSLTQTGSAGSAHSPETALSAAISAAVTAGVQDSGWLDDIVSFASTLAQNAAAGTAAWSGQVVPSADGADPSAGQSLASDLGKIATILQQSTAQAASSLSSQGDSASQGSASLIALSYTHTTTALGAVVQGIVADTRNPGQFTVTSDVSSLSTNGSTATISAEAQTESFTATDSNTTPAAATSTMSVAADEEAASSAGSGTDFSAGGSVYEFDIVETGPRGDAYAGTSAQFRSASQTTSDASGAASITAAVSESASAYYSTQSAGSGSAAGEAGGLSAFITIAQVSRTGGGFAESDVASGAANMAVWLAGMTGNAFAGTADPDRVANLVYRSEDLGSKVNAYA